MARVVACLLPMATVGVGTIHAEPAENADADQEETVPPFVPGSFTIAVLPDTQYYHRNETNLKHFFNQTQWIADHAEKYNIAYVIHLGDLTQDNLPEEWQNSREAYEVLDEAGIPYSITYGNHDYYTRKGEDQNRPCLGNEYFTTEQFATWPTYGGVMEEGKMDNNYHLFEVNGVEFIIINLRWSPPDAAVAWADEVLTRHADRKAIFVTHGYLYYDNTRYDRRNKAGQQRWAPGKNDGERLWQELLKKHENVVLVLSGHVLGDGQGRLTSTGEHGNKVHQILSNYQMLPEGGHGFLRLMEFLPDGKTIQAKSYSPSLDEYKTGAQHQFTLELEPSLSLTPAE
ncbi:MAG: metallophosphoesterase [Phycisphaeraceae bacterium]